VRVRTTLTTLSNWWWWSWSGEGAGEGEGEGAGDRTLTTISSWLSWSVPGKSGWRRKSSAMMQPADHMSTGAPYAVLKQSSCARGEQNHAWHGGGAEVARRWRGGGVRARIRQARALPWAVLPVLPLLLCAAEGGGRGSGGRCGAADLRGAVPPRGDVHGEELLGVGVGVLGARAREAKVADLEPAVPVDQDVARLEIAMHH
jgi:hypothetical protein